MTPQELYRALARLPEHQPMAIALETKLARRLPNRRPSRHRSQKEHWEGWLTDYDGPGYYTRQSWDRTAAFVYNHIQCASMLLWLAEAAGVPKTSLERAARAVLLAGENDARQCAALRKEIKWLDVERALLARS